MFKQTYNHAYCWFQRAVFLTKRIITHELKFGLLSICHTIFQLGIHLLEYLFIFVCVSYGGYIILDISPQCDQILPHAHPQIIII